MTRLVCPEKNKVRKERNSAKLAKRQGGTRISRKKRKQGQLGAVRAHDLREQKVGSPARGPERKSLARKTLVGVESLGDCGEQ